MKPALVSISLLLAIFSFSSLPISQVHASSIITLDGVAGLAPVCNASVCSINMGGQCCFTTAQTNDILIIFLNLVNETVTSVQDQTGLIFKLRLSEWQMAEYYAVATSPLVNDNVTVTTTKTQSCSFNGDICGGILFAVNGAYSTTFPSPFDTGAGAPFGSDGISTCGWNFNKPVLPSGDNSMIIGGFATDGAGSFGPGQGFTFMKTQNRASEEYLNQPVHSEIVITGSYPTNCITPSHVGVIADIICPANNCETSIGSRSGGGGGNFQTAPGPGGYPIPPQLADQNVLSLMGIISGIILLSAVPGIEKHKKKKDSFI